MRAAGSRGFAMPGDAKGAGDGAAIACALEMKLRSNKLPLEWECSGVDVLAGNVPANTSSIAHLQEGARCARRGRAGG